VHHGGPTTYPEQTMSYFSDASLVFIPSAQKSGKAYSIKPTDGTGDLTFTRSNDTATRVNSAGLIEKVRTNLALYSQNFSQTGTWVTSTTTRVDSQTDPNGGTTASKFTATGANSNVIQTRTVSSGIPYTWSFYAKSDSATDVNIRLDNNNGNFVQANMALTTSWQRFSITLNSNATTILCFLGGGVSFTAGEVAYMAFAQLEASDIVTDYIATTSAAVSVGPVANVPRLDYLGSSCPRLLLEPQRTNLITFSEQLDNAAWNKLGITVAANNTTSPSGYIDADKLIADAGTGNRVVYQGVVPVGVSTTTVYAKAGEFGGVVIASGTQGGFFNLTTGEYRAEYNSAPTAYNITSASNGWYRCSVTMTSVSGDNLYIGPNDNVSTLLSITGDGTSGIYAWGAQLEAGAYATSYIPTLGASVTRGADDYYTNSLSSLHDTSNGFCLMFDYGQRAENADIAFQDFFSIQVSAGTQDGFRAEAAGSLNSEWRLYATNITASFGFPMVLSNIKTRNKVLLKVETTGIKIFADGALAVSQSGSVTIPTFGTLQPKRGTSQPLGTEIKQSLGMIYFSPLLDDADCIALTA
jgi:hypothetical protein